jgi:hypothetical protein
MLPAASEVGPSQRHLAEVLLELADPRQTPTSSRLFFTSTSNHSNAAMLLDALYDVCPEVQVGSRAESEQVHVCTYCCCCCCRLCCWQWRCCQHACQRGLSLLRA